MIPVGGSMFDYVTIAELKNPAILESFIRNQTKNVYKNKKNTESVSITNINRNSNLSNFDKARTRNAYNRINKRASRRGPASSNINEDIDKLFHYADMAKGSSLIAEEALAEISKLDFEKRFEGDIHDYHKFAISNPNYVGARRIYVDETTLNAMIDDVKSAAKKRNTKKYNCRSLRNQDLLDVSIASCIGWNNYSFATHALGSPIDIAKFVISSLKIDFTEKLLINKDNKNFLFHIFGVYLKSDSDNNIRDRFFEKYEAKGFLGFTKIRSELGGKLIDFTEGAAPDYKTDYDFNKELDIFEVSDIGVIRKGFKDDALVGLDTLDRLSPIYIDDNNRTLYRHIQIAFIVMNANTGDVKDSYKNAAAEYLITLLENILNFIYINLKKIIDLFRDFVRVEYRENDVNNNNKTFGEKKQARENQKYFTYLEKNIVPAMYKTLFEFVKMYRTAIKNHFKLQAGPTKYGLITTSERIAKPEQHNPDLKEGGVRRVFGGYTYHSKFIKEYPLRFELVDGFRIKKFDEEATLAALVSFFVSSSNIRDADTKKRIAVGGIVQKSIDSPAIDRLNYGNYGHCTIQYVKAYTEIVLESRKKMHDYIVKMLNILHTSVPFEVVKEMWEELNSMKEDIMRSDPAERENLTLEYATQIAEKYSDYKKDAYDFNKNLVAKNESMQLNDEKLDAHIMRLKGARLHLFADSLAALVTGIRMPAEFILEFDSIKEQLEKKLKREMKQLKNNMTNVNHYNVEELTESQYRVIFDDKFWALIRRNLREQNIADLFVVMYSSGSSPKHILFNLTGTAYYGRPRMDMPNKNENTFVTIRNLNELSSVLGNGRIILTDKEGELNNPENWKAIKRKKVEALFKTPYKNPHRVPEATRRTTQRNLIRMMCFNMLSWSNFFKGHVDYKMEPERNKERSLMRNLAVFCHKATGAKNSIKFDKCGKVTSREGATRFIGTILGMSLKNSKTVAVKLDSHTIVDVARYAETTS